MGVRTVPRNDGEQNSRLVLGKYVAFIIQVRIYFTLAYIQVTDKLSNLYILLYRSAYLAENDDQSAGNVALQAACRNTRITEDVLAQDLVQHLNVHMYAFYLSHTLGSN
jgi:hypothetical protein